MARREAVVRRVGKVGLSLVFVCLATGMSAAADDNQELEDANANPTHSVVYKGKMELAAVFGVGSSHGLWHGVDHVSFLSLGARFGRVLSAPRGPGILEGNLEAAAELLPLFRVNDNGNTTYGLSFTALGRHYFMPSSLWRPYALLGFGFVTTKKGVPNTASPVNFTPQAGLGVTYSYQNRFTFYVEYRLHHMSTGANGGGINPGVNSSVLQFSASVFRW